MKPYSPRSFFPSAAEFIFASAVVTLLGGQFLSAETWTGASSTDWTTGTNWTPVGTPDPYTDILINNQSLTNQPKLFAGDSSEVFNVAIFEGVLTVHGDLIVRDQIIVNSTGIMDISGGSVDSFVGSIGERIGSTGLVKVRAGGNWESLEVVLGGLGGGTLEISSNGTVDPGSFYMGRFPGSVGLAKVWDGGSLTGVIYVGESGSGTLEIGANGSAGNIATTLGVKSQSKGILSVQDGGSWVNEHSLKIGSSGEGALEMTGGSVNVQELYLAQFMDTIWNPNTGAWEDNSSVGKVTLGGGVLTTRWIEMGDGHGSFEFKNGGTLRLSEDVGNLFANFAPGDITLGSGGGIIDVQGHSVATTAILSGGGSLTKSGVGALSLTGANTYTGGTTIKSGTLSVGATGSISHSAANLVISNASGDNGALVISGGNVSADFSYVGFTPDGTGTATISSGSLSQARSLFVGREGPGTLNVTGGTVSGNAAFIGMFSGSNGIANVSGGTWATASTFRLGFFDGTGTLNLSDSGLVSIASGTGQVSLGGSDLSVATLNLGTGGTAGTLNAATVNGEAGMATVNFNHTGSYAFAPVLTGSLSVNKLGAGTTTLAGDVASTYDGATTITGGTLSLAKTNVVAIAGNITIGDGGATPGMDTLLLFGSGGNQIADTSILTFNGTGADAGVLNMNTRNETVGGLVSTGGAGLVWNKNPNFALFTHSTLTLNVETTDREYSGILADNPAQAGELALTKTGTAMQTLSGGASNTYASMTNIFGGTLMLAKTGATAIAGNITIGDGAATPGVDLLQLGGTGGNQIADHVFLTFNGTGSNAGTFRLNGRSETVGGLVSTGGAGIVENNGSGTAILTLATNSNSSYSGIIRDGAAGKLALVKTGTATLTLTGTNTYTGATIIDDGILSLSTAGLADGSTVTIGSAPASPAILHLTHAEVDTVDALVIDGQSMPAGIYDSTNSGGAITGTGKIQVGAAGYGSWLAGHPGLSDTSPGADPDGDGLTTLLEFVLNRRPDIPDHGSLPKSLRWSSNPATGLYDQFAFDFDRRADSIPEVDLTVEFSSDLASWWGVKVEPSESSFISYVSLGQVVNGMQRVTVNIPIDPYNTPRYFARLKAHAKLPFGNLLQNGSGAAPANVGWNIIANGGSGWEWVEGESYDTTPGHFRTSYGWCRRSQTIDLVAAGLTPQQLEQQPRIRVGEAISSFMNNNIPDSYYIKVELRDQNQNVIATWNRGTLAAPLQATSDWVLHQHDFTNYGPGVRYVYFEDGGIDNGFWAGPFGTYHDAASVEVISE